MMCRHCGDGGCAYCDGFISETEVNATRSRAQENKPLSLSELKQRGRQPDYEQLQLNKQSKFMS